MTFDFEPGDFGERPAGEKTQTAECPHCYKSIDSQVGVCPYCKLPTDEIIQVDLFPKSPYKTMRRLLHPLQIIAAVLTIGMALGLYGYFTLQAVFGEHYLLAGDEQLAAGHADLAIQNYQQAVDFDASNPAAYERLGWVQYQLAADSEALEWFEQALALESDRPTALYGAGLAAYELRNYEIALAYLQRVRDAVPTHAGTYQYLGLIQYRQGDFESAYTYFTEARVYDPRNATTAYYLGRILAHRGDTAASLEQYDLAESLGFTPGAIANARGLVWLQVGDYAAARAELLAAAAEFPAQTDVALSLARVHYLLEDYPAAAAQLSTVQAEVPAEHQPEFLALWGWVSLRMENHDAALAAFNSRLNLSPESPEALNALGWAVYYSGDCGAAGVYFERALDALDSGTASFHDPLAGTDEVPENGLTLQCP